MRKIAAMLIVFAFIALPCVAEEPIAPAAQEETEPATLTVAGKVSSVVLADAEEGIRDSVINVVDDMKNEIGIVVNSDTEIYNTSMVEVSLDEIKKGDKVSVEYTETEDGSLEAMSIKMVE